VTAAAVRRALRWLLGLALAWVVATALAVLVLRWVDPPTTAFMLEARAHLRAATGDGAIRWRWVDLDRIAPPMRLAVVASEDQTFPSNHGFDWTQIGKALDAWRHGARLRGASTITQQTAKNLFLWPAHSFVRKGIEAYFTVLLDLLWPKRRILEVYLNVIQLGDRTFGVGAAARHFFREPPSRLTPAQAALLAAVLPDPSDRSVTRPSRYVRRRQAEILRQMRNLGPGYLRAVVRPAG